MTICYINKAVYRDRGLYIDFEQWTNRVNSLYKYHMRIGHTGTAMLRCIRHRTSSDV